MEAEKQTNARVFDELSAHDSRIGQELLQQKVLEMIHVVVDLDNRRRQTNLTSCPHMN